VFGWVREDELVLWGVEETVVVEVDVVEDFVEDVTDVDVVVWIRTENCVRLCPLLYPALLAEAYIVYCPWIEFMGKLNESEYAPDWSESTS
jgi:hypothetical protein